MKINGLFDPEVKKLKAKAGKQMVKEVMKESTMLSALRHENIINFIGVCLEPDNICLVTEFMSRGSL